MRARGIKPSFFTDEAVVDLAFETRLLFIGLWCQADREGRLEDRPRQLQIQLFPCDQVDVEAMLGDLDAAGLIKRYESGGARYIQVVNFAKHQRPHSKEVDSVIPAPDASAPKGNSNITEVSAEHDLGSGEPGKGEGEHALTPDCGPLSPEENILSDETPDPPTRRSSKAVLIRARFEHWRATFPEETQRLSLTKDRQRAISARLSEGIGPETIDEAVTNARGDPWWNGAKDGEWKADIKTICGKGSTVENLAARSRQGKTGLARLREEYGGTP